MKIQKVMLKGAAVHTRDIKPGQDYEWLVHSENLLLFDQMNDIHRLVLRDVSGDAPLFCLIIEQERIGLLMGDLKSSRIDHANRHIYNTLYLEFDRIYQNVVCQAVARFLVCSKNTYIPHEQHFSHYAEMLLQEKQISLIKLPDMSQQADTTLAKITADKLIVYSNADNLKRCAHYLTQFTSEAKKCFYFISTGRVSLDKCKKLVKKIDQCLILTLSSDVESDIDLKKGGLSLFSKK